MTPNPGKSAERLFAHKRIVELPTKTMPLGFGGDARSASSNVAMADAHCVGFVGHFCFFKAAFTLQDPVTVVVAERVFVDEGLRVTVGRRYLERVQLLLPVDVAVRVWLI